MIIVKQEILFCYRTNKLKFILILYFKFYIKIIPQKSIKLLES